jgi:hypothetical protein
MGAPAASGTTSNMVYITVRMHGFTYSITSSARASSEGGIDRK